MNVLAVLPSKTRRALFDVLRHAAHADRRLSAAKIAAAQAGAWGLGLDGAALLGELFEEPPGPVPSGLGRLAERDRHLAFGFGAWMVMADDIISADEDEFLAVLRFETKIARPAARRLVEVAWQVRTSPATRGVWRREFEDLAWGGAAAWEASRRPAALAPERPLPSFSGGRAHPPPLPASVPPPPNASLDGPPPLAGAA